MRTREFRCLMISVLGFFASGCTGGASNTVNIKNASAVPITDIQVSSPHSKVAVRDLLPNETAEVNISAQRDGVILLSYQQKGHRVVHEVTYVAPPIKVSCEV